MAINVASLPKYVEQKSEPLLAQAMLSARTIGYMNVQTGIKTSASINILDTEVKFGDGKGCGWKEQGTDTFSQRIINTGLIAVNKSFCAKTLLAKWTETDVNITAGRENLPFEEKFMENNTRAIARAVEKAIWQGDTSKAGTNLAYFDGLIKLMTNDEGVIDVAGSASESKIDLVKKVLLAMPAEHLDGARIFCSPSFLRHYGQELVAKNYFHYEAGKDYNEFPIMGSNVILTAVEGLEGTETNDYLVGCQPDNLYYGCDLEGDSETFDLWFERKDEAFLMRVNFNAGVQFAFPDRIVLGTIARA